MCGIVGFWEFEPKHNTVYLKTIIEKMTETLHRRGPDDKGSWVDPKVGIALGHRRLSILDLSEAGHQPMISHNGRYVLITNGEIYNFLDLRLELETLGHRFRGHSDTEVMLECFTQWGIEASLKRFNGMFAFTLWDRYEQVLTLARDRFGEKPLYYGQINNTLFVASELKAIRTHPHFKGEINREALALYLRHNYIPAPYSIYRDIRKLPPSSFLQIQKDGRVNKSVSYWSFQKVTEEGSFHPLQISETEATRELNLLLLDAVRLRMIADVPLGAFLSGGIDSSTVVALMQAQSRHPVKTFTIGFYENRYNEAESAKAVAGHLGTDHTELYVTPQETRDIIPLLPYFYDEPFSDSSQIPTFVVAKLTRQFVTVSLSGDGGDEVFGGYDRYFLARRIWRLLRLQPLWFRRIFADLLTALPLSAGDRLLGRMPYALPAKDRDIFTGGKFHKLAAILRFRHFQEFYLNLISHWKDPIRIVHGVSKEPETVMNGSGFPENLPGLFAQMMNVDTQSYLPDDILVKVDRASMGVGLETRIPFLDPRVVEYAWRLPLRMKIRGNQGKWILRQVLDRYVPKHLIERPKMGFGVPIDSWLRGPLKDWAEELLSEDRLRREGFFDPEPIRTKWREHLSGFRNWQYYLWDILMFQAWLEKQESK